MNNVWLVSCHFSSSPRVFWESLTLVQCIYSQPCIYIHDANTPRAAGKGKTLLSHLKREYAEKRERSEGGCMDIKISAQLQSSLW